MSENPSVKADEEPIVDALKAVCPECGQWAETYAVDGVRVRRRFETHFRQLGPYASPCEMSHLPAPGFGTATSADQTPTAHPEGPQG